MKLSDQERAILAALDAVGPASIAALADAASLKAHAVRYGLENFLERGVLSPFCSIDPSTFGFNSYITYFSFKPMPPEEIERALASVTSHPHISWIGELSGSFQYGCTVCAKGLPQALSLFGEIAAKMKIPWHRKAFAQRNLLTFWPLKYFGKSGCQSVSIHYPPVTRKHVIDELDHTILKLKSANPAAPCNEIARMSGQAPTTIAYRIGQLVEKQIINGNWYVINWGKLGIAHSEVSLLLKRIDPVLLDRLVTFGRETRRCYFVVGGVGSWDFQFNVLTEHPEELHRFTASLWHKFGDDIETINISAYTRLIKFSNYPFSDLATVLA